MAAASPIEKRRSQIEWATNGAGFLFYLFLAIRILVQSPQIGLWMLPSFLHELIIGLAFLTRRPLRRVASGFLPRATAYLGTFVIPVFLYVAAEWRPSWLRLSSLELAQNIGALMWVSGSLLGLWTVWSLRRSFSLVAQARFLVTSGPYRFARHPIYGCYILQYVGLWLAHWSVSFAVALVIWFALTIVRMHFEESVLQAEFLEYSEYRQTVGPFSPRLRRCGSIGQKVKAPLAQ